MSNKMLMALFVVGAVAVGTIALRNRTQENNVVAEETAAAVVEEVPATEEAEVVAAEVSPEATTEAVVAEVATEEKTC